MVQRTLKVTVVKAQALVAMDMGGTSDPYIQLSIGNQKVKTTTKKKTLNPEYKETFEIKAEVPNNLVVLGVNVFDWNRMSSDKPMGAGICDMYGLKKGVATDVWVPLMVQVGKGHSAVKGAVHLQVTPVSFGADPNAPFVPKDYKPLLDFLDIKHTNQVEDVKKIMEKFNLMWENTELDFSTGKFNVGPEGLYIENCLRKYYTLCFSDTPAGVDKEGFKASMVDTAHYYAAPIMAAPLIKDEHLNKVWDNFEKKDGLIPNLYAELCDAQKLGIIDTMTFSADEAKDIKANFDEWKTKYAPKKNTLLPLLQIFEVASGTEIIEDVLDLREAMKSKVSVTRIMIKALFESYFKAGKNTVSEAEFTEFMQTAIPVFQLEKTFKNDAASIKKLFEDVDKDKSGGIDQFEFLYWFDLKASMELVTANNELMDALKSFSLVKLSKMKL